MTKKDEVNGGGYEWEYAKKIDNRTTGQKILNFIYNPQTHAFLGRTAKSWGGILLFYAIFYAVLALLFTICMKVLLSTINSSYPKWQLEESIIGTNPGLGFRPRTVDPETASVIWFHANNSKSIESWTTLIDKFLTEEYQNKYDSVGAKDCYSEGLAKPSEFCKFSFKDNDKKNHPCFYKGDYGYKEGKPCIFLKLNRIYNWKPDVYKKKSELPLEAPKLLRDGIEEATRINGSHVWVTCAGQSPHDNENIGPLEYYPSIPGFPAIYYPYSNAPNYTSPLVAVRFKDPRPNVLINIECKAWAKNIYHKSNAQLREGSVHLELQVDMILNSTNTEKKD